MPMEQRDPARCRRKRRIAWSHRIDPKRFIRLDLGPINIVACRSIQGHARTVISHGRTHLIELCDIELVVCQRDDMLVFESHS